MKCHQDDCWNTAVAGGYCSKHQDQVVVAPVTPTPEPRSEAVQIAAAQAETTARSKSATAAVLLSVFIGYFGIDRFYVGHTGLGILKLVTCGGAGVWWIVDWFLIGTAVERVNVETTRAVFARHGL